MSLNLEQCILCLKEKKLRNSHIIPEFMYVNIYDKDPKRFYTLKVQKSDVLDGKYKIEQKGIREKLLCNECEVRFSKYEKYADETIFGKNNNNKVIITESQKTDNERFFLHKLSGFNYEYFKLFLMSLIWRILVSKSYDITVDNKDDIEILRKSLDVENPMLYNDFPCLIQTINYDINNLTSGFILNPFLTKTKDGINIVNILIDGFMYSFHLGNDISVNADEHFLRENGDMNLLGRIVFDDEGLFNQLLMSYDFFKTIKRK